MNPRNSITILVADDDSDDRLMIQEALEENRLANALKFVEDGEQLMEYLKSSPLPGLILLDLNMPRMDGRECLAAIKKDPRWKSIPVVVLTTSKAEEDIIRTYDLGVNSFITKPLTFESLVRMLKEVSHYWLEIVELPVRK
jgi:CheY-like chemotaxis protein